MYAEDADDPKTQTTEQATEESADTGDERVAPPPPDDPLPTVDPVLPPTDGVPVPDHVVRQGPKAIQSWKSLHSKVEETEARAAELERTRLLLEQERDELKKQLESAPPPEEIKRLKEALQAAEDKVGQLDVTQSLHFKESYDKPLNDLFSKVVKQFMKAGHDQQQAAAKARAVFRPGMTEIAELERALPDETATTVGAVSALLEEREALSARRDDAINNWRQTSEAARLEAVRRQSSEISAELSRVAEGAFDQVVADGSWLYKTGADPKWNEGVAARKAAAVGYIRAGKMEDLARLVLEGVAAPVYRRAYDSLKAKYDDAVAQLAAISAKRPGLGSRSPAPPASGSPRAAEAPKNVGEFINSKWEQ